MDERATGFILRTYPLSETSLIVQWLTQSQGRIATVAKGARRQKSPFRGKLDLFFRCDFSFARSRRSELHTLKEVTLLDSAPIVRQDLRRLHHAAYASALIQQTTETDSPVPELFDLLAGFLSILPRATSPVSMLAFELKLLEALGLSPEAEGARRLNRGTNQIMKFLLTSGWNEIDRLKLNDAQLRELRQFLQGFLAYHLGKILPTRKRALDQSATD